MNTWHDNWISDVFRFRCMRDVYISRAYGLLRFRCAPGVVGVILHRDRGDRRCCCLCRRWPRAAVWPHGCAVVATDVVQRVSSVCVCGPFYLRKHHVCVKCCMHAHTWCTVDLTDARCLQLTACCLFVARLHKRHSLSCCLGLLVQRVACDPRPLWVKVRRAA